MIKLLLYVLAAAGAAVLADLATRRIARRGECSLHRGLVLPDTCQGRCPPGQNCVAFNTRRHWLFGRQAAGCGCAQAREGGSPLSPPDFADPPRKLDAPEREDEDA